MQIYIRTPLVHDSQAIPHMVEHCVARNIIEPTNFFGEKVRISKEISGEWTKIFFDKSLSSLEIVLEKLQAPILKSVYAYEKLPFKEECENIGQGSLIYEVMIRKIVDKKITLNTARWISWEGIVNYHKQHYHKENMLIFEDEVDLDQEFQLIFAGEACKENDKSEIHQHFDFPFSFDWANFFILGSKGYDVQRYWKMIFTWTLLGNYCRYLMRYQKQSYFYEETTLDFFRDYLWLTTPDIDYSLLSESFFENGKKYLLTMLENWYFKEKIFLANYCYQIPALRAEILKICKDFQRNDFMENYLRKIVLKKINFF